MGGLKGLSRIPRGDPRARRNSAALAIDGEFAPGDGAIQLSDEGEFVLVLRSSSESGLKQDDGLYLDLKASGGLEFDTGLKVSAATTSMIAGVKQAMAQADSTQNSLSLTTITDPADTPATADDLRDDLVTNTLPNIRTSIGELEVAIETLAGEFNDLLSKLRAAGSLGT